VLFSGKPTRELDAQLFKELRCVDVWVLFKTAALDWPSQAQRMDAGVTGFSIERLVHLAT
jgi:hypothetical protein